MKVYVVTAGEYSSYGIEAVFLDRDKAEVFCANHNKSDAYECYVIEEYDSADDGIEAVKEKLVYRYNVYGPHYMAPRYTSEPVVMHSSETAEWTERDVRNDRQWDRKQFPYSQRTVYLDEPDAGKAIKIVQDRYAKWKAEKEGLT